MIWTQISYSSPREAHLKSQGLVLSKRRKMRWNCRRSFFKNHRNCSLRISTKGLLIRTFNSYSFNFKVGLCNRRTGYCPCRAPCPGGDQFLWFLKIDLLRFHLILLSFDSIKRLIFEIRLARSTIANVCPIMINFNALDFNECHSEEVMFLLTLSVSLQPSWWNYSIKNFS